MHITSTIFFYKYFRYVQHIIHDQKTLCWEFLNNNGNIYLAGNSKNMPNCVREEFINLVKDMTKSTQKDAENFIKQLENENRYQVETWG